MLRRSQQIVGHSFINVKCLVTTLSKVKQYTAVWMDDQSENFFFLKMHCNFLRFSSVMRSVVPKVIVLPKTMYK